MNIIKTAALMSIEQIRNDLRAELITFGPHLAERMFQNGISIDQVFDTILNGSVRKKETDEHSEVNLPNIPSTGVTLQLQ